MQSIKEFEENTKLNVRKYFFEVDDKNLSEKEGKEVTIPKSAKNWIENVYKPIIKEFEKSKISDFFPHTNSVSLYVQIMAHKYYLSIENEQDVGINKAMRSYLEKYSKTNPQSEKPENVLQLLIKKVLNIFPANYKL